MELIGQVNVLKMDLYFPKLFLLNMAGILFTDETLVLAGYNEFHEHITGFGGKNKNSEYPYETAIREIVEELLEIHCINEAIYKEICQQITFDNIISYKAYSMYIMSFRELEHILFVVRRYGFKSKLYDTFPRTVSDLIFKRKKGNKCEFDSLVVLPMNHNYHLKPEFLKDMLTFKNISLINR